jgi:hypothetical protein
MAKEKWIEPELIVLVTKTDSETTVLAQCKLGNGVTGGSWAFNQQCHTWDRICFDCKWHNVS